MSNSNVKDVYFSQLHPAYKRIFVGTSNSTIEEVGCLLCCVASMIASYGIEITPPLLNWYLTNNQGYFSDNLLVFASIKYYGFDFVKSVNCRTVPANTVEIEDYFNSGMEILVEVNATPHRKQFNPHWLWLRKVTPDEYFVFDSLVPPRYNPIVPLLATYGRKGWNLSRVITRYVIYRYTGGKENGK